LQRDNVDKLRQVLQRHTQSVWVGRGENQVQWALLQAASRSGGRLARMLIGNLQIIAAAWKIWWISIQQLA